MADCIKKILITQIEYEILKCLLPEDSKSSAQAIYYYDTDDMLLNKLGASCRIAESDGKHMAYISMVEGSEDIETSLPVDGPFDKSFFKGLNVKYQGKMLIERNILYKDVLVCITLDKNLYLSVEDYELGITYVTGQEHLVDHLLFYYQRQIAECMNIKGDLKFLLQGRSYKRRSQRFFFRKKHIDNLIV